MGYTANQSCCICGGGIFKSLSPSISPQIQNDYREPTGSGNLSISPEMAIMRTRLPSLGEISPLVQNSFVSSVYPSISSEVAVTFYPSSKKTLPPSDRWASGRPSLSSDIYGTSSSSPSIYDSFVGFQDIDKTNEILPFSSEDTSIESTVSNGTTENTQILDSSKEISRDTLIVISAFVAVVSIIAIIYAKVGRPI